MSINISLFIIDQQNNVFRLYIIVNIIKEFLYTF